jgi:regulator of cell morphogenesis and NO signaling
MEKAMKINKMDSSFRDRPLGEMAVSLPGSTAVFRRHGLDFCCGGKATLKQAAEKSDLDLGQIEAELAALIPDDAPLSKSTASLIEHILRRYHDTHRRELWELEELSRKVEARHADHPDCPRGLTAFIGRLAGDLLDHMEKEERILFPMMLNGGSPMIVHPISVMREEHDEHGVNLQRLSLMTRNFTPPADGCTSWKALYAGLNKLTTDLMEHVNLENNLLFPRFEQ